MTRDLVFTQGLAGIHPRLQTLAYKLETARDCLATAYRIAESNIMSIDHTVADDMYPTFMEAYIDMVGILQGQGDVNLAAINAKFLEAPAELPPPIASLSLDSREPQLRKRPRADSQDEDADTTTNDGEEGMSSSAITKRARHDDSDVASAAPTSSM